MKSSKKVEIRRLDENCLLSIVAPVYNEEAVLHALGERLKKVMDLFPTSCEVILVNDGSRDGSIGILKELAETDERFRVVDLARNFGHQLAVSAGLFVARGDAVAIIDADLQDPPELIESMLERWADGVDVVYGRRSARHGETRFKILTSKLFYRTLERLTDINIPNDAGDFRLVDRSVVDIINKMPERHRFLRGMFSWIGFRQEALDYERHARFAGETKYPLLKMISFSLDGVLSFSMSPLRFVTWLGLFVTVFSFLAGLYILTLKLISPEAFSPGLGGMFVAILFLFGVNFLVLGIIGEYVGRTFVNIQGRPAYIIREIYEKSNKE